MGVRVIKCSSCEEVLNLKPQLLLVDEVRPAAAATDLLLGKEVWWFLYCSENICQAQSRSSSAGRAPTNWFGFPRKEEKILA